MCERCVVGMVGGGRCGVGRGLWEDAVAGVVGMISQLAK